ncbi:DUF397 domain-containing protein [Streptomyces sp. NPDC005132]|uniref:DUF397 domain-containing protein n=1 Tax=Streptomyces sp. NPDC005132 TaxID=3154294 RepID=UPI0033AE5C8A
MNAAPSMAAHVSAWFTSSYSNGAGGECVECARGVHGVLVRDSKDASGPVVAFRSHSWRAFTEGIEGLEGDRRSAVRPS